MAVILCVDDDASALEIRKLVLERHGYEVKKATTADEAMEILTSSPIDLVITDHLLTGKTGAELVADIKRLSPSLPVLVLSGMTEPPPGTELADLYITKGEGVYAFLRHVESLLPHSYDEGRFFIDHAYTRQVVERDGYTLVLTICKQCGAGFTGNVTDLVVWEENHHKSCYKA